MIYVGQGKNNRGRPRPSGGGRCWQLAQLLEERWADIEPEYTPCVSQRASRNLEQQLIEELSPKYNKAPHYGGFNGMHSEEGLKGISEDQLGREHTKAWKKAMSKRLVGNKYRSGIKHSDEARARIGASLKGRKPSKATRKAASKRFSVLNKTNPPRKGKTNSAEHNRKVSEALKKYHQRKQADAFSVQQRK